MILFLPDSLDADLILKAALRTKGAVGLAGLDAFAWRRLCSMFKSASVNLCRAVWGIRSAIHRALCNGIQAVRKLSKSF